MNKPAGKFENLSDDELADKMSKRLMWLEDAYLEAANRASDKGSAELSLEFASIHHSLKALHCKASILGNQAIGTPMVRGGER